MDNRIPLGDDMDRCLIIGGNSGIGLAVSAFLSGRMKILTPGPKTVNVARNKDSYLYLEAFGPFPYIVYSAGVNELCWIKDLYSTSIVNYSSTVNVGGFIDIVSIHLELFPDAKVSAVAVSSDAADIPMRGSLAYCVSKAALNMAIRVMARELAPLWRVNGVAPGMVEGTDMTRYIDKTIPEFRGWTPEYAREYERSSVPTGRRATLEEVASTIAWVLTGPGQMTGEIVRINGGK